MKLIRGLYVAVCYVIGIPLWIVLGLIYLIYAIVTDLIYGYGFSISDIKEYIMGFIGGMKDGHKINMDWIRYGKQAYDLDKLVDKLEEL